MIATTASPKSQVRAHNAGVVLMNGRSGVGGVTFVGAGGCARRTGGRGSRADDHYVVAHVHVVMPGSRLLILPVLNGCFFTGG